MKRVLATTGWVLLAATLLEYWATLRQDAAQEGYFNADALAIPSLLADLTRWGGHFSDWALTPAPYFFPDMALYALFGTATGSVELGQYLSGLIQLPLFAWGLQRVLYCLAPETKASTLGPVLTSALVIALLAGRTGLSEQLVYPAYHGGVGVLAMWCTALALEAPSRTRRGVLFALALLGGLSDDLFTIGWAAPALAIGLFLRRWRALLAPGLAAGAGLLVARLTLSDQRQHAHLQPARFGLTMEALFADLSLHPHVLLVLSVGCIWSVIHLIRTKRDGATHVFVLLLLGGALFTAIACALTGNSASRYFVWPYLAAISVPALVVAQLETRGKAIGPLFVGLATFGLALQLNPGSWAPFSMETRQAHQARSVAHCLEELAQRAQTTQALSDYWTAKPVSLFSEGRLRVLQLDVDTGGPFLWITNKAWYCNVDPVGLVIETGLSSRALERLPVPERIETCGPHRVRIYEGQTRASLARLATRPDCP